MKHLLSREQLLTESLGTGSIIFVNGQEKDGMKKLYVTHIKGYKDLGRATMYFLANDFYRVKKEGDSLKAVKVGFDNEDQLRKALSIKKGGEIVSIVGNWKKTPWHKESVKYTSIESALREFKPRILGNGDLLLESSQASPDFDDAYNLAFVDVFETIFFNKKSVDILAYTVDGLEEAVDAAIDRESKDDVAEWNVELTILFLDEKYTPFIEAGVFNRIEKVSISMASDISLSSYYAGGAWQTDASVEGTELVELYVDGALPRKSFTDEMVKLFDAVNEKVAKMNDVKITQAITAVTRANWYSKFF
jgi:hypothetical protein